MNARKKYRFILIEPSQIIQQGIATIVKGDPEFETISIYDNLVSFQEDQRKELPQLIILNPALLSFYQPIVVKSYFREYPSTAIIALHYGVIERETLESFDGVIHLLDDQTKIIKTLKRAFESIADQEQSNSNENVELSDREKEILISVARGLTNKEIAEKRNISIHTVISHRKNISRKIGIKTVAGLTLYALFNNLITQEEQE